MTASPAVPTTADVLDPGAIAEAFGDLATVAPVARRIIELVDDEDVTIRELADVIRVDPGLAARLLRLANSAAYSRGHPVTDLQRAAMLIGLRTLKLVTLGFTLCSRQPSGPIDSSLLWRRSVASSVLARRLAARIATDLVDDAFIAGLLSNVGKTALDEVPAWIEAVESYGPWLSPAQEQAALGFTTDELTALILHGWGLPSQLSEAIWSRRSDPEEGSELGPILRLADDATILLLADDPDEQARALDAATLSAAHLGLTISEVERFVAMAAPELEDLTQTFELETVSSGHIDEILTAAQTRLARLSLDLASQLTEEQHRHDELLQTAQELAEAASTDPLTGLPNRRTFDAFLLGQVASRIRHERPTSLGLILMDLDKFKAVNDTWGHAVGDEVLATFSDRLSAGSRRGELAARIGGEEFGLILPDVEPEELAGAAERLRVLLDTPIETSAGQLQITLSLGASWVTEVRPGIERELYETADNALYESKGAGRNRVTLKATPAS